MRRGDQHPAPALSRVLRPPGDVGGALFVALQLRHPRRVRTLAHVVHQHVASPAGGRKPGAGAVDGHPRHLAAAAVRVGVDGVHPLPGPDVVDGDHPVATPRGEEPLALREGQASDLLRVKRQLLHQALVAQVVDPRDGVEGASGYEVLHRNPEERYALHPFVVALQQSERGAIEVGHVPDPGRLVVRAATEQPLGQVESEGVHALGVASELQDPLLPLVVPHVHGALQAPTREEVHAGNLADGH
mmetsp:Transcript_38615/g.102374  ORF Transcript_38615/g.102374 Transcript_38615/m.102374 type:complete len:245 (-) Transcript_38615:507-1241(-)